jgi:outer membrane receptor protein involved in Fe transport
LLEPLKEKVIRITGQRDLVQKTNTSSVTQRSQDFIQRFAPNAGNRQNLGQILKTTPGFAQDSVNQVHPRAEHHNTALNIDGFALGGVLQGRGGPTINPEVIQNLNVLTGGYAPEYGGEMAAVLNVTLKAGSIRPIREILFQGGEFGTLYGSLQLGGQAGRGIGAPDASGNQARKFGYYLNLSGRRTDNALDPPQPDEQTAHNRGESQTYFGNISYNTGGRDNLTLAMNASPAYTQIASRTGLPPSFADTDAPGWGYAGHLNAADAAAAGVVSQHLAGQDIYQRDNNDFGALNWRHTFNDRTSGLLSFGLGHAGIDILNSNPAVNLNALPADNSIEFNPTIRRHAHTFQIQGNLTVTQGNHTFKFGLRHDDQGSNASYNLIPASQLAVNALAAVDTRLLPAGSFQTDANGDPVTDEFDNPVFNLDPNPVVPTVNVHHTGFYRAFYAQDTWNASRRLTANYGARLDWYKAEVSSPGLTDSIDTMHLSPRVNLAYLMAPGLVARAIYNRTFSQPPLAEGGGIGLATPPQVGDHYETSLEKQIGNNQTVKLAYYYKDWRQFADTGLLIEGTQIGAFTTVSHPHVNARGIEFSYDLAPRNNVGFGSYITWAHSINRLLAPEDGPTDHDQLNTVGFGIDYTWASKASAAFSLYHGSGVASSVVSDDKRNPRTILNFRLSSAPNMFGGTTNDGRGGLSLEIENLTDDRTVINFASPFSGTRFQQGRRILVSAFGRF